MVETALSSLRDHRVHRNISVDTTLSWALWSASKERRRHAFNPLTASQKTAEIRGT